VDGASGCLPGALRRKGTPTFSLIVALVGWTFATYQLVTDRWIGSTGLLVAAAVGAALVVAGSVRTMHATVMAGLLLIVVSASVFACPLSGVALVLLAIYGAGVVSQRHRGAQA
jgi:hypothetical protein